MTKSKNYLIALVLTFACHSTKKSPSGYDKNLDYIKGQTMELCPEYMSFFALDSCGQLDYLDSLYNITGQARQVLHEECFANFILYMFKWKPDSTNLAKFEGQYHYNNDSFYWVDRKYLNNLYGCD